MFFPSSSADVNDWDTAFFDLANVPSVSFRSKSGQTLEISQDSKHAESSGGVIWETSFLLASLFESKPDLLSRVRPHSTEVSQACRPLSVLEVGAGCGLLGLVLAHMGFRVVLTDAETATLRNLNGNVQRNSAGLATETLPCAMQLRWGSEEDVHTVRARVPTGFDVVVGTDVLFATRLVEPLLWSIWSLSSEHTDVWMCMQIRCADSHALFLETAPRFFEELVDESHLLLDVPSATFAAELGCLLFRLSKRVIGAAAR
eukprot:gnl/Spiro4/22876_TR11287_c3_g4_i1.p1 gnl/Spiro4/22876_TR11287_c3_g4~~gnl/Spiro4/22876_TR11287_c3_g4_i1.p1  ORF type:complete len:277 (+),score=24.79 gnl/Spiro4/22876_TR11287_c3_g4_i1:57-833(+)